MAKLHREGLERALKRDSGLANRFARQMAHLPTDIRRSFASAHGEGSTSPTLWAKPNGKLDKAVRADLMVRLAGDNVNHILDHPHKFSDEVYDLVQKSCLMDGELPTPPEPETMPVKVVEKIAERPVRAEKVETKASAQFGAVWASLGIPEAVESALAEKIAGIVADVKAQVKIVKYEVHERGEVREVPGLKHKSFEECLDHLVACNHPWVYGPSGTGKTSLAAQLADALGVRYAGISASPGMSGAEFEGWLLPTGAGGQFEHIESIFLDFVENGGLFLIDEIANLPADVASKLNMLIAQRKAWISKRFKNPEVIACKKFYLMAADNTSGRGGDRRFVRQQQDSALRNRFSYVRVGYDRDMESALFGDDKALLGRVWALREKAAKAKLDEEVGLRQIQQPYVLRKTHGKDRWNVDRCIDSVTAGWSDDDRAKVGLRVG